jgi:hypothetical protein
LDSTTLDGMPARPQVQHDLDRARVVQLYIQGKSQWEIARAVGIPRAHVAREISVIRQKWLASQIRDWDELKSVELMKIDNVESTAWEAYEQSRKQQHKKKYSKTTGSEGDSIMVGIESTKVPGDPRFLQIILECGKQRRELLGLDAPKPPDSREAEERDLGSYTIADLEDMHAIRRRVQLRLQEQQQEALANQGAISVDHRAT